MRWLIFLLGLLPVVALAQSGPNWPQGKVPSAAEWEAQWESKVNTTGGTSNGQTLNSAVINSPSVDVPTITGGSLSSTVTSSGVATATGASTSRSIANHFNDIINALDFGATFDGVTDDSAAIQAGIDYLETLPYGGTLLLPVGNAAIGTTLTITKSNIHIIGKGLGSNRHDVGSATVGGSTRLTWIGASSGTMVSMAPPTDIVSGQNLSGDSLENLRLDCASTAGTGLEWKSISRGKLSVFVTECTADDVIVGTVPLAEFNDAQANEMSVFFTNTSTTGNGVRLTGAVPGGANTGNASFNHFLFAQGRILNGNGIIFEFADNNILDEVKITVASGGTGIPVLWGCSDTSVGQVGYYNTIRHYSSNGTAIARGTTTCTYPSNNNIIDNIDTGNSTPDPTVETGASMSLRYGTGKFKTLVIGAFGSGAGSAVLGGNGSSSASGQNAIVLGGTGLFANGFADVLAGQNTICSGNLTVAFGDSHGCSGGSNLIIGAFASDRGRSSQLVQASGRFSTTGDAQTVRAVLRGTGSSTSAIRLTSDGAAASGTNCVNLTSDNLIQSSDHVVSIFDATTHEYAVWTLRGAGLRRATGAANTTIAATTFPTWTKTAASNATSDGWSAPAMTADTTNACMNISWTPPGANTDTFRVTDSVTASEVQ